MSRILELVVPVLVVAFVAVLVVLLLVTACVAVRHPMDVVVTCALSGAVLSLGLSVVVQHGAFTHLQATAGDPASVALIALTWDFCSGYWATAAARPSRGCAARGQPGRGRDRGPGVRQALMKLATTLLVPYGYRGIALTMFAAFVLAGAGLWPTRPRRTPPSTPRPMRALFEH